MPIFEYECGKCGHQFEALVLPTWPAPKCPSCQSKKLNKQISLCAVSSEGTKANALKAAKRRNAKQGKEMAHAEHEAYHKAMDDH